MLQLDGELFFVFLEPQDHSVLSIDEVGPSG